MSQMEKEGFGEEFSICSSFCFGEISGGQKTEKSKRNIVRIYYYLRNFTSYRSINSFLMFQKILYALKFSRDRFCFVRCPFVSIFYFINIITLFESKKSLQIRV